MRWSNVRLIFRRELKDQLRDRRTIFMIFVLPILLYPPLLMGMFQIKAASEEKQRTVVLVGAERLPERPALLNPEQDGFSPALFDGPAAAGRLRVNATKADSPWRERDYSRNALRAGQAHAVVIVPEDARKRVAENRSVEFDVFADRADERSELTYHRVRDALESWNELIVRGRLAKALPKVKPDEFLSPVKVKPINLATPSETGAMLWAHMFPFLLVIMSLTGAFYPAIDLCAGEKERGTIETLLICPASRAEIVFGKFLTVMAASMASAILNIVSMGLTAAALSKQIGGAIQPPSLASSLWMILLLIPLSGFFSAVCVALAIMAKSMKEGQYYMTPLYMVALPLIFITLSPDVELDLFYSLVPITGVSLLLRALLEARYDLARQFFLPVLLPTILYGLIALRWAVDQFQREEVLFRESERFDISGWLRHIVRDRQRTPSAGEALFCFALMLSLAWFVTGFITKSTWGLLIGQVGFILAPPVLLALILTSSPRDTLRLKWPSPRYLFLAVGLVVALNPVVSELGRAVDYLFPVSNVIKEQLTRLVGAMPDFGTTVLLMALVPAICEEFAFRGFILSGLAAGHRPRSAIFVSAFLFGFLHVLLSLFQQLFGATVLGVVLGLLAIRSKSLLPGIIFHFLNNFFAIARGALAETPRLRPIAGILFRDGTHGYYHWYWIALGGAISAALLWTLFIEGRRDPKSSEPRSNPNVADSIAPTFS